ncbi:MAG TPA: imelysin family protein [Rhizomicrobium sp.]|nr:imelysin family protein [Rhizomicrobium sp.]
MKIAVLALLGALFPFAASAAIDPVPVAQSFAKDFAVPRFQAVASAAHAQADAWSSFCADRRHGNIETLKAAYNAVADAWARIEFVRIGPAAIALRVERFNWWLDRTDATGKALSAMLADPAPPAPEKLAAGSVAGQGLPVIERLLYDKASAADLKSKAGAKRCAIGAAVAQGQAVIADAIVTDWTSPDGALAALMANTRWQVAFADAKEAASVELTDLAAGLEGLKDLKVAMLFHDVKNAKAPRLAEAVRSGRTLTDIRLNLAALREGLAPFVAGASAADKATLDKAFDDAAAALDEFEHASDKDRMNTVVNTLAAFTVLSQAAIATLPTATGLNLGFNNLDGD